MDTAITTTSVLASTRIRVPDWRIDPCKRGDRLYGPAGTPSKHQPTVAPMTLPAPRGFVGFATEISGMARVPMAVGAQASGVPPRRRPV